MPDLRAVTVKRSWIRAALFALLAWNTGYYLLRGTSSQGLDSAAWLTLLVLFELESGPAAWAVNRSAAAAIRLLRLAAAGALGAALLGYLREQEWLDAINSGLWIAVVGLLEIEVRRPDMAMRTTWKLAAAILYAGLGALALAWLLRGEWFGAYDAALWLAAFATLELDLLDRLGSRRAGA